VLLAALMHATWNAIAHAVDDRLIGFALIGILYTLLGAATVTVAGLPSGGAWAYIAASAVVHVAYNLFLLAAYQWGEFSQTYPLARGLAPVLVVGISVWLLNRDLTARELSGVGLVSVGLVGLALVGGVARQNRRALSAAAATGAMIATYTVIDGLGVTNGPVLAYVGWMFLLQGPALPVIAWSRRRRQFRALVRRHLAPGVVGGTISFGAYAIVLWAQTSGKLAPVAALRESSIVFGALIGALFLGERLGWQRGALAAVVLVGVALLST
jgi:drug/metabolite transporter (DMT)-like permease